MFIDLLRTRRSVRKFAGKPIEQDKLDQLIEAILRSPSSRGLNPWEFVVVRDPQTLSDLAVAKPHGASFIKNAPLAIVVCGDAGKSDVWVEDCSIAALICHLTAADLGLGSCWVQLRMRDHDAQTTSDQYVKKLLGLPDNLMVEAVIAIGYPAEDKPGHAKSSLLYDQVSFDTVWPEAIECNRQIVVQNHQEVAHELVF